MAYPFLLVVILVVINQQDTPPNSYTPCTPEITITHLSTDFSQLLQDKN